MRIPFRESTLPASMRMTCSSSITSAAGRDGKTRWLLRVRGFRFPALGRKQYQKTCTLPRRAMHADRSTVGFDDSQHGRKAQASACKFRREEWVEDASLGGFIHPV